jgi:hypothetical protein
MKEQLESIFQWASKKIQFMSTAGAIGFCFNTACNTIVALNVSSSAAIPPSQKNCQNVERQNKGTDVSTRYTNCGDRTTPTKEKETLQGLHQLSELDLEKLFPAGEYTINQKEALELKNKGDSIFRALSQHKQVLYIQGSADKAGDSTFIKSLSNEKCGSQEDFNQIYLHASVGDNYEKQLSSNKIHSPFTNAALPQLRARSFQCWLRSEYPAIPTEIIEGGVQLTDGSQYRRVRIFIKNTSTTNQVSLIPND